MAYTDAFTGTNGNRLGTYDSTNWTDLQGTLQILSNKVVSAEDVFAVSRRNGTYAADQYCQAVLTQTPGFDGLVGPMTRIPAGTGSGNASGYALHFRKDQVFFGRMDAGSYTNFVQTTATTTSGDTWRIESVGNTHKVYVNGVQEAVIGTITDSTYPTGSCGICGLYNQNDTQLDAWEGGDISSGVTGTLASTLGNTTLAAAGTTTVTGAIARTLANATLAAAGTTTVTGTLARTLANTTLAAAGTTTVTGTLAQTLGNTTLAASGSVGASGTIAISTPAAYQVFPRTLGGTTGPMLITGTYTGSPDHIQAQIVKHGTSTVVTAWTTIVASPSAGSFSGTITGLPQTTDGSWYDVQVRSRDVSNTVIATANGSNKTGIGIVAVIAGQSNAIGHANDTPSVSNDLAAFYDGSAWSQTDAGGSTHSVAPDLQNALITKYNIPVAVSISAQDGTNLYSDWARNGSNPTDASTLYGKLLNRITALGSVEAIFWLQGEGDANDGRSQAQYESDLSAHIANLRSDMGYTVPFIYNQLGNLTGSSTGDSAWQAIRNAQLSRDNGTNILVCTAHDLVLNADGVHFQSVGGFTLLGPRFSNALAFYLGGSTYYRGPAIISAAYTDGTKTVIDVTLTHRGGTTFTPTSGITGFVILDGGSPATISSAVRQSSIVVRLTLSGAISGTGTLRYLYGKNPTVSALVVDNTALALPLEGTSSDLTVNAASITGTIAKTLDNITLAAAGTTTVTGSIARSLANATLAAAGTTTVTGAIAKTLDDTVLAASGYAGSSVGTIAVTLGNVTLAAVGATPNLSGGGGAARRKFKSYDQRQREREEAIRKDAEARKPAERPPIRESIPSKRLSPATVKAYAAMAQHDDEEAMNLIMSLI